MYQMAPEGRTVNESDLKTPEGLIKNLNSFSFKIYQTVAEGRTGNLAVSPLGSYVLLGLLGEGAKGRTREEIASVTQLGENELGSLASLVKRLDKGESLELAQRIYLDKSRTLQEGYVKKVTALLDGPAKTVPFLDAPEVARQEINAWVAQKTSDKIQNFLPSLPGKTLTVLVSTLYFRGLWKDPFSTDSTRPGPFQVGPNERLTVPMMKRRDVAAFQLGNADAVVLPYTEDFEMLFLLPSPGKTLDDLTRDLPTLKLPAQGAAEEWVTLSLPRFEFTTPTFLLNDAWREAGLATTLAAPDFSGMWSTPPSEPTSLAVYHQTYLKVDESGTTAAAATGVIDFIGMAMDVPMPRVVAFDRPFLAILRHSGTGAVLMLGRVERPEIAEPRATRPGPQRGRTESDQPALKNTP